MADATRKICGCGRTYTAEAFLDLPKPTRVFWVLEDPPMTLALRHCPCGSTIGIRVCPCCGSVEYDETADRCHEPWDSLADGGPGLCDQPVNCTNCDEVIERLRDATECPGCFGPLCEDCERCDPCAPKEPVVKPDNILDTLRRWQADELEEAEPNEMILDGLEIYITDLAERLGEHERTES